MTVDLATLPSPDTLPIPDDVQPSNLWAPLLVEIADHIGARLALEMAARFGGQFIRIPRDPTRGPFGKVLGEQAARELSRVFGGERLEMPLGSQALRQARRQGILARVRANELTLSDAARLLRIRRAVMSRLINGTDEGAAGDIPRRGRQSDPRQIDLFD